MNIRPIPRSAIDLVKKYEGFSGKAYKCPAGLLTIGYGHLITIGELSSNRFANREITREEAEAILREDLKVAAYSVLRYTKVPLNDNQYAALISFVFNLGPGAYQRSTLRSRLNRGEYHGASEEFLKWVWAGGKKLSGLIKRRTEESDLFLSTKDIEFINSPVFYN